MRRSNLYLECGDRCNYFWAFPRPYRLCSYPPRSRWTVHASSRDQLDKTVCIWDAETGTIVAGPFEGHTNHVSFVAFFPDNKHIFSVSKFLSTCMIYIWDIETRASVSWKHASWVCSVAFSLDGKHAVLGSYDTMIYLANAETGATVSGPFQGHTSTVESVAFSHDGKHIVSGSRDNTICIWNVETETIVSGPISGHVGRVVSVAFSQDDKHVLSFSNDQMIRIWTAKSRTRLDGAVTLLVSISHPLTSFIF